MQEWHPIISLYDPNQIKLMINSNLNKISNLLSTFDFGLAMKAQASL